MKLYNTYIYFIQVNNNDDVRKITKYTKLNKTAI